MSPIISCCIFTSEAWQCSRGNLCKDCCLVAWVFSWSGFEPAPAMQVQLPNVELYLGRMYALVWRVLWLNNYWHKPVKLFSLVNVVLCSSTWYCMFKASWNIYVMLQQVCCTGTYSVFFVQVYLLLNFWNTLVASQVSCWLPLFKDNVRRGCNKTKYCLVCY